MGFVLLSVVLWGWRMGTVATGGVAPTSVNSRFQPLHTVASVAPETGSPDPVQGAEPPGDGEPRPCPGC